METGDRVTGILARIGGGDPDAIEDLLPLVYAELRAIADRYMRRERKGHTLQPTALTHEAYLRLVGGNRIEWQSRAHFLAIAAQAMRRILIEHARARRRKKRGGGLKRTSLSAVGAAAPGTPQIDVLALNDALERLSSLDERKGRVVELLYFGGLTAEEVGEVLCITGRTVERDWRYARLWLLRELSGEECP
jgi:RNA polymerase sigma factor (TIGR02999 family)